MRGGGDDVAVLERRALLTGRDETRDVSHVREEVRALAVGDLSETSVVPVAGVGRTAANDETGLEEVRVGLELGVVDDTSSGVDAVRERLEVDRRSGDLLLGSVVAVGEVAAVRETETHDTVLGVDQGGEGGEAGGVSAVSDEADVGWLRQKARRGENIEKDGRRSGEVYQMVGQVAGSNQTGTRPGSGCPSWPDQDHAHSLRGRARVGLDVDTPDLGVEVERLESALSGEVLELVDELVAAVVTGAGETLRVLVGEDRAVGLHDGEGGEVLRDVSEAREWTGRSVGNWG